MGRQHLRERQKRSSLLIRGEALTFLLARYRAKVSEKRQVSGREVFEA
jgi:hypothetical protein